MHDIQYLILAMYGTLAVWVMAIYFAWCVVVGFAAQNKNRSGIWWVLVSVFVSPMVTTLMLVVLGEPTKVCKFCKSHIHAKSRVCEWCDAEQSQVK